MAIKKYITAIAALVLSIPAFAASTAQTPSVSTPGQNATVNTSFPLVAAMATCNSLPVVSMGYSFDSQPNTLVVTGQNLSTTATTTEGNHIIRVKAWAKGTVCVNEVAVNVVKSLIPSNAISSGNLTGNSLWKCQHDSATSGASTATMSFPVSMGGFSDVQKYSLDTYSNYGGERCSIDFGKDANAHNFIYDVYVQMPNPTLLANLELDMNQVTPDGKTHIFAFQCSKWAKAWEYTYATTKTFWAPTQVPCNPQTWTANVWHHIQFYMSRDDSGHTTYHWVSFDGQVSDINITSYEALSLGWAHDVMVVNFQMDPAQSTGAPVVVYARQLTIYRW
jgi:hypothetical protein